MNCFHYLHRNPVNSSLVKELSQWGYSSYLDYAELRNGTLCDKELFFSLTGLNSDGVIIGGQTDLDDEYIKKFY